jgi:hypothetical protein
MWVLKGGTTFCSRAWPEHAHSHGKVCFVIELFVPTSKALCRFHERKHFLPLQVNPFLSVHWTSLLNTLVLTPECASVLDYQNPGSDTKVCIALEFIDATSK